jgi:hypothetical protein
VFLNPKKIAKAMPKRVKIAELIKRWYLSKESLK